MATPSEAHLYRNPFVACAYAHEASFARTASSAADLAGRVNRAVKIAFQSSRAVPNRPKPYRDLPGDRSSDPFAAPPKTGRGLTPRSRSPLWPRPRWRAGRATAPVHDGRDTRPSPHPRLTLAPCRAGPATPRDRIWHGISRYGQAGCAARPRSPLGDAPQRRPDKRRLHDSGFARPRLRSEQEGTHDMT